MKVAHHKPKHPFELKQLKRRTAKSHLFKMISIFTIFFALSFLLIFITNILYKGISAFNQTYIQVPVHITKHATTINPRVAIQKEHRKLVSRAWVRNLPQMVKDKPSLMGVKKEMWILADDEVDQYIKGKSSKLISKDRAIIDKLKTQNKIDLRFNIIFFTHGDSKMAEYAGFLSAIKGTIMTIFVTMLVSFPIGVMTAIYLEEFAQDSRVTQIIEININNLASVPPILFGLLGLAVFINVIGIPRSSALVGGLTLGMMTLPIIIVSTRTALRSVPKSIREAGFALGLTKFQVVRGSVMPLAMPGIMTGSIISLAHAIGETSPLLLIGMITFIPDSPSFVTDATTVMSAQIYTWASMPQGAYIERTSAAILILLGVMVILNMAAIMIRSKFSKRYNYE
ncbi:MAG: phosphate ABC transporter permease PstA [Campylobacterales bacterium]|nr:phosphate ABC transporter permease PstA [Campylobacterales bacterium]